MTDSLRLIRLAEQRREQQYARDRTSDAQPRRGPSERRDAHVRHAAGQDDGDDRELSEPSAVSFDEIVGEGNGSRGKPRMRCRAGDEYCAALPHLVEQSTRKL
jgi:hypothetical protein